MDDTEAYNRYSQSLDRNLSARKSNSEFWERKRIAEEKARQEAALQAQQLGEQARRQERQQAYDMQNTAHRANINADSAAMDHLYSTQRDQQHQKGTLKRDELQGKLTTERDRRQALDQQIRDQRQFGFQTQENDQQFGHQIRRDELQHGNTMRRDQQQQYNTLERDASQFGYSTLENKQQQRNTLERDSMQFGQQLQRDELQNGYSMERAQQDQQYTQQNLYQRETADVAAQWNDRVQQARSAGLDFSPRQQQEMKELDESFRKNVMNSDLDEGLKQQAMLMHQKKLAAIIPNEKIVTPEQEIQQQFYEDPRMGMMRRTVSQHGAVWEPLGLGSGGGPDPAKEQAAQQKAQQQQAEKIRKAYSDREDRWDALINEISTRTKPGDTDTPLYADPDEIEKQARKEFAAKEKYYRELDGLEPHYSFQREADAERQKMEQEMQKLEQEQLKKQRAEQKRQQTSQYDVQRKPATTPQATENPYRQKLEQTAQPKPIVFSYKTPVSPEIRQQLKERTGSDELYNIREKHKSNSVEDQTIRLASEILMKALLTNDISNPHLAESIETLRTRAGLKME